MELSSPATVPQESRAHVTQGESVFAELEASGDVVEQRQRFIEHDVVVIELDSAGQLQFVSARQR